MAIQELHKNHKKRWVKTGQIVEALPNRQYRIKVDGSGRVTLRNRRHLKPTLTVNNPPCPDIQPDNNSNNTQNPPSLLTPNSIINEHNAPINGDMPNINLAPPDLFIIYLFYFI